MSWVQDKFTFGEIAEELKIRAGVSYAWGEWKTPPIKDSCKCDKCHSLRLQLYAQARERHHELQCPDPSNELERKEFAKQQGVIIQRSSEPIVIQLTPKVNHMQVNFEPWEQPPASSDTEKKKRKKKKKQ